MLRKHLLILIFLFATSAQASELPKTPIKVPPIAVDVSGSTWRDILSKVYINIKNSTGETVTFTYNTSGFFCKSECRTAAYKDLLRVAQQRCKYIIIDGSKDNDSLFSISEDSIPNCSKQIE